ncbi:MAG: hypothetical protein IMZ58_02360 [Thermoplasmata archaeon]|nr:hypothetical protein [Thermoplasmata archaeon]
MREKMKVKLPKQNEPEKLLATKKEEKPLLTEGKKQETKKEKMSLKISGFHQLNTLTKLRVAVTTIFFLCTSAVLLIFVTDFIYPALLLILSYILLFMFMIKLFMTKKL